MRGDFDLTSEIFEAADEPADGLPAVDAVEVIGAQVSIVDAVAKDEVGGIEHGGKRRPGSPSWVRAGP